MGNLYETVNENGYIPTNGNSYRLSWLDLRVFYVRISRCGVDHSTPHQLTMNHIPLDPNTLLEVNGVRANLNSEGLTTLLRRDRIDKNSEEVTFVSTDSVRTTGSLRFEVFDKGSLVLNGSLDKCDSSEDVLVTWSIRCESDVSGKLGMPIIEVYVAGCYMGDPIMLAKTLNLNSRRKPRMVGVLNPIPENDDADNEKESVFRLDLQGKEHPIYKHESECYPYHFNPNTDYFEGEDGELSWFNAGVRVGVGIGLGVCVGLGIGVGLLVKTYRGTTTRSFRRRVF